jgi:hypothetical protein
MVGFSLQDVAFGGFADVRANARALLVWTPVALVASLGQQVASIGVVSPRLDQWSPTADPAVSIALFARLLPAALATGALALVVGALVQTAMIRLVLRPAEHRFGYVRLGADELRQLGLALLGVAVMTGVYFAVALAASLVFGVLAAVTGAPVGLALGLDIVATLAAVALVAVRLSLAPALTFARGRIDLFGSWTLTRGRFWSLLGVYVMVLALCAVVYVFAAALIFGLGRLVLGPDIVALSRAPASVAELLDPLRLILVVFGSFLTALIWPVLFTPSVRLYAALAPRAPAQPGVWA